MTARDYVLIGIQFAMLFLGWFFIVKRAQSKEGADKQQAIIDRLDEIEKQILVMDVNRR